MGRWQPGAADRLRAAALELFEEQGYEQATVAGIAERAGVTERTFYRYFADKREVLFAGSERLEQSLVAGIAAAPAESDAAALVDAALAALAANFTPQQQAFSRRRSAVLDANPALRERELLKLASLKAATIGAFTDRGTDEGRSVLAAEVTLSVFHIAFTRWITDAQQREFADLQREALAELRSVLG